MDFIRIKELLCFKGHCPNRKATTEWEKTFVDHIYNNRFIFWVDEQYLQQWAQDNIDNSIRKPGEGFEQTFPRECVDDNCTLLSTISVREMPTKTTRYHIIPTSVAKIKKATIIVQQLLKKLKLPYDQASLLQGKYPWDSKAYVHTKSCHRNIPHSRQGWRQPKCPSSYKGTKYMIVRQLNIICQLKK